MSDTDEFNQDSPPPTPDTTPHPNPDRYETCSSCGNAYKLIGAKCASCSAG